MPFSTAAILRDSPGTRQATIERHEGQSQKETPSAPSRRLAKAASMSLLGNRRSDTPQFGSLLASRTSQMIPESHEGRSQQETRMPSPHRLAKSASTSLLGNRQQFGSLLALVTSQMTAEKMKANCSKKHVRLRSIDLLRRRLCLHLVIDNHPQHNLDHYWLRPSRFPWAITSPARAPSQIPTG